MDHLTEKGRVLVGVAGIHPAAAEIARSPVVLLGPNGARFPVLQKCRAVLPGRFRPWRGMSRGFALVIEHAYRGPQYVAIDSRTDPHHMRPHAKLWIEHVVFPRLPDRAEIEPPAAITRDPVGFSALERPRLSAVRHVAIRDLPKLQRRADSEMVAGVGPLLRIADHRHLLLVRQVAELVDMDMAGHRRQRRNRHPARRCFRGGGAQHAACRYDQCDRLPQKAKLHPGIWAAVSAGVKESATVWF